MPPAAVIFDLDDTLLDSSSLLVARDARAWRDVYSRLDEVVAFDVAIGEPAITTLPDEVRRRGLGVGLLTHSPSRYANELMRTHGIRVGAVVTGSDGYPAKPDPTGLLAVARELAVDPAQCVYVGDSVGDFGAAAAAGIASIGVSWDRRMPASWRRGWPDIAIDRPSRLLQVIDGVEGLGPIGEMVATRIEPTVHWGSIIRLGRATYALGRYFQMGDRRYPSHALSRLIIAAKNDPAAQARLAEVFAAVGELPLRNEPELVVSVPPKPDAPDRFIPARAALADLWDARDGARVLTMRKVVEDYKFMPHDVRAAVNADRFASEPVAGKRTMVIDDVVTSGSQADACRQVLSERGAVGLAVLVAGVAQDQLPDPCPACGEEFGGRMRTKTNSYTGQEFLGCSRWPHCSWSSDLPKS